MVCYLYLNKAMIFKKAINEKGRRRESHMYLGELPSSKVEELVSYLLSPGSLSLHSPPSYVALIQFWGPQSHLREKPPAKLISEFFPLINLPFAYGCGDPIPCTGYIPLLGVYSRVKMTAAFGPAKLMWICFPQIESRPRRILTRHSGPGTNGEGNLCIIRMSPFYRCVESEAQQRAEASDPLSLSSFPSTCWGPL